MPRIAARPLLASRTQATSQCFRIAVKGSRSSYAEFLETDRFLNADEFAAELSSDAPGDKAVPAGRRLIELRRLWLDEGIDFIIESTLATKTLLRSVKFASANNYRITLVFLWVSDTDICIQRVANRVSQGGHYTSERLN